uniref:Uncharacterized protein n=1 Tax=Desertifilum tharense IPPAS B-1220 TaxID=1781255 RepID=A0ACD5H252_9CYAN
MAVTPDSQTLVSGSEDQSLKVWNLQCGVRGSDALRS